MNSYKSKRASTNKTGSVFGATDHLRFIYACEWVNHHYSVTSFGEVKARVKYHLYS